MVPPETWGGIWGRALGEKTNLHSHEPFRMPQDRISLRRALDAAIIFHGNAIGTLLVGNKTTDYDDNDRKMLETIADGIAPILNARLLRDREEKTRGLTEDRITHLNAVLYTLRNVNHIMITETDRERLVKRVCETLIETRGYHNAWIALFDESRTLAVIAESGLGKAFVPMAEKMKGGALSHCSHTALSQSRVVVIREPLSTCTDCPLARMYAGRGAMTVRLEYGKKVYGLLSVSIPVNFATDEEEQLLLKELAEDIAFALHSIEAEDERTQAEKAVQESRERYRGLVETMTDIVFTLDTKGNFTYLNPEAERIAGYKSQDLIGRPFTKILTPEYVASTVDRFKRALSGETIPIYQVELLHKHGTTISVELNVTSLLDAEGKTMGRIGIARNVTERKRAVEERNKLQAQLQQSQKMEAIGTLAGGVAHDFNNLLTVIIGNADLALMNIREDADIYKNIEEIRNTGERAASLTRQLLAFSRKQIIQPRTLNLNEVVTNMEKMLHRLIGEDIDLATVFDPDLYKIEADPGQMEQVIMNLTVNARDAMPKRGKLTIETANVDLDTDYFKDHGLENQPAPYVMLAITDTGKGMNRETQAHIFEPFFTTKERDRGTGLGLSTVYGIVKQNQGQIWVYSEPERGTTFKIYFPRSQTDKETIKKDQPRKSFLKGDETILIVEDYETLRTITGRVLKEYGYNILTAPNGEEALNISSSHKGPIDLLLTDVIMPGMDGKELAGMIQQKHPHIKIIYMSGYTDNTIALHGVLEEGLNFIQKPFSQEDLARSIRKAMDPALSN